MLGFKGLEQAFNTAPCEDHLLSVECQKKIRNPLMIFDVVLIRKIFFAVIDV